MLIDFLKTKRTKEELQLTLDVLREFLDCESTAEYHAIPFEAWAKLEQFYEFLAHLAEGRSLEGDTLCEIEKCKLKEVANDSASATN